MRQRAQYREDGRKQEMRCINVPHHEVPPQQADGYTRGQSLDQLIDAVGAPYLHPPCQLTREPSQGHPYDFPSKRIEKEGNSTSHKVKLLGGYKRRRVLQSVEKAAVIGREEGVPRHQSPERRNHKRVHVQRPCRHGKAVNYGGLKGVRDERRCCGRSSDCHDRNQHLGYDSNNVPS